MILLIILVNVSLHVRFLFINHNVDMDLNKVMIIGRSTDSTEVKQIESNNTAVVNFVVATNRKFSNKEGNEMEEAEYHRCVAYGSSAEVLGKYLHKGKRIYVEGRLRTRKWEDSAGITKHSTEIIVTHFIFLDTKSSTNTDNQNAIDDVTTEDVPF